MKPRSLIAIAAAALCLVSSASLPARAHHQGAGVARAGQPYQAGDVAYFDAVNRILMLEEWRATAPEEFTVGQFADRAGTFVSRTIRLSPTGQLLSSAESLDWNLQPADSAEMKAKMAEAKRLLGIVGPLPIE